MTTIALPAIVDLAAATALAETLRATAGPLTLEAAAVERIGAAGLQLLLSARASAEVAGHTLAIDHASAPLIAAAATAGAGFLLATDR